MLLCVTQTLVSAEAVFSQERCRTTAKPFALSGAFRLNEALAGAAAEAAEPAGTSLQPHAAHCKRNVESK